VRNMDKQRVVIEVNDILPPKKAAEYLGITTMTLWRWVRDGKIATIMLDHTYFHKNELDRVKTEREKDEQNRS
jgi:excisionase family DNA binding protein